MHQDSGQRARSLRLTVLSSALISSTFAASAEAGLLLPAVQKRTDTGSFLSYNPFPNNPESAGATVAAADLDGDGFSDIIVGGGPGGGPHVLTFDRFAGNFHEVPAPRDSTTGHPTGRRVAAGHVTDAITNDLVVAGGPGEAGVVQTYQYQPPFNGTAGQLVAGGNIMPFGPDYTGGISVAAGDLDGSSVSGGMIVAAAKKNYVGHVTLIKQRTDGSERVAYQFDPFSGDAGTDNVKVAVGNGAGTNPNATPYFAASSIITAAGAGGGPHVKLYSVTSQPTGGDPTYGVSLQQDLLPSFLGFGNNVDAMEIATGDVNGDGIDDLIVSIHTGPGGGPNVKIFDMEDVNGKLTADAPIDVDLTDALSSIPADLRSSIIFNVAYSNLPVSNGDTTGALLLSPALVPEPSTAALILAPVAVAALRRRRKALTPN